LRNGVREENSRFLNIFRAFFPVIFAIAGFLLRFERLWRAPLPALVAEVFMGQGF